MKVNAIQTQIDSYHAHIPKSAVQRTRILDFIEAVGGDWSIGEIAHCLKMQNSTVSARVWELLNETHELVACPNRKDVYSGVTIRPVCLATKQLELFH